MKLARLVCELVVFYSAVPTLVNPHRAVRCQKVRSVPTLDLNRTMSPAPPIKRPAPTPPTLSHSQSSSTRPTKRVRRSASPVASTSALPPPAAPPAPLAAPTKRVVREGTLRRLALPRVKNPAVLARSTLSGAKIGGRSKDLKRPQAGEEGQLLEGDEEEIWVGRKGGMSFGGWLKRGVAAFVQRGCVGQFARKSADECLAGPRSFRCMRWAQRYRWHCLSRWQCETRFQAAPTLSRSKPSRTRSP